ncbi:sugar nucleotide-binding protein [Methanospirillum sp.]|uniref:sugar nucleotide-binding protein n=1 Tax=Methanospirillum sp. TaxID=45200 RepID=UPI0035A04EF6
MSEKYLIIGEDSQIGSFFTRRYSDISVGTTRRREKVSHRSSGIYLNLEEDLSLWAPPKGVTSAVIFTAVTSIEKCQRNPEYARFINVEKTKNLIDILHKNNIFIVFPSTNQVFNGTIPYQKVGDTPSPQTEYGKNKLEVENYLLINKIESSIIRFSKIIPPDYPLFQTWITSLKQGESIHPFHDMVISPVSISFACMVIRILLEKKLTGIFQVSADDDISYANIAHDIGTKLGYNGSLIQPVSWKTSDIQLNHVPEHTTLDTTKLRNDLGIKIPDIRIIIDEIMEYYG